MIESNILRDNLCSKRYWNDFHNSIQATTDRSLQACRKGTYKEPVACLEGDVYEALYTQLHVKYSRGDNKESFKKTLSELIEAMFFYKQLNAVENPKDDAFRYDFPCDFQRQLSILGFAFSLGIDQQEWKNLAPLYTIPNSLIDRFLASHCHGRVTAEEDKPVHATLFRFLYDIHEAPNEVRPKLIYRYLKQWEKKVLPKMSWSNRIDRIQEDPNHEGYFVEDYFWYYFGHWAVEVVPFILHYNIDDTGFDEFPCYPKDLVMMGKSERT